MNGICAPAHKPPEAIPAVMRTMDGLLSEALEHADRVTWLFDAIESVADAMERDGVDVTELRELLRRRHSDCCGAHLFVAARLLGLPLQAQRRAA